MPQGVCLLAGYAGSEERSHGARPNNELCVLGSPTEASSL